MQIEHRQELWRTIKFIFIAVFLLQTKWWFSNVHLPSSSCLYKPVFVKLFNNTKGILLCFKKNLSCALGFWLARSRDQFMLRRSTHFNKCCSSKMMWFQQIWCHVCGEFGSVADIVVFCHVMRLDSGYVAMVIVLIELPSWYFSVHVKYGYRRDNWNLSRRHKLKTSRYSFIRVKQRSINKL